MHVWRNCIDGFTAGKQNRTGVSIIVCDVGVEARVRSYTRKADRQNDENNQTSNATRGAKKGWVGVRTGDQCKRKG